MCNFFEVNYNYNCSWWFRLPSRVDVPHRGRPMSGSNASLQAFCECFFQFRKADRGNLKLGFWGFFDVTVDSRFQGMVRLLGLFWKHLQLLDQSLCLQASC